MSARLRTTLVAGLVSTAVLVLAAVLLVRSLDRSLTTSSDRVSQDRLQTLAAQVSREGLPAVLPDAGDGVVQVVGADGTVLAASPNVAGRPRLTTFRPSGDAAAVVTVRGPDDSDVETYRVWAQRIAPEVTAYVGDSLESVAEASASLRRSLAVGVPLALVLVLGGVWVLVGRSLRPVAEARERERTFLADASHELLSPLAASRALLESGPLDQATAAQVLAENASMERLVRDLLDLARGDDQPVVLAHPLDLDDLVLEEVARLRGTTPVAFDVAGVSAGPVVGDREQLRRLVRNLLENAARHARSTVRLRLATDGADVRLEVVDDGPGVDPALGTQVFQRFRRGDGARARDAGGAGLGLAIARAVAERHGGTLGLGDSPTGACFVLSLPAA